MAPGDNVDVQLAGLEFQLRELQKDVAAVLVKLDGPPYERSVRGRLHELEGNAAAATAVREALEVMRQNSNQSFSRRQKMFGAVIGLAALMLQLVTVLTVLHQ